MRILVIEDDEKTAAFIARGLKESGCNVLRACNGVDGQHLALTEQFDAAVIDVMLPDISGLTVLEAMRGRGVATPVLVLSAKASLDDKIAGLRAGGDDYLTKPFAFAELLWRIRALVRRAQHQPSATKLVVADLEIDAVRREVRRDGRTIVLQPREYALLEYLARNAGQLVTKTMIMEHVWEYDFDPGTNIVESRISHLRNKVDDPFPKKLIRTVRGAGYILGANEK